MSFFGLLAQRCMVQRLITDDIDGTPDCTWLVIETSIPCRIDLSFPGDGGWVAQAGRPEDRAGKLFLEKDAPVKEADRITMTAGGIDGTFEIQGKIDKVIGRQGLIHHLEVGVVEVAQALVDYVPEII